MSHYYDLPPFCFNCSCESCTNAIAMYHEIEEQEAIWAHQEYQQYLLNQEDTDPPEAYLD